MRIRKYAKVSPLQLLPGGSSSGSHASVVDDSGSELLQVLLQPHVCQLNQSPWDAPDSFLPLPLQYQRENNFTGTVNSSNDSAPMQESFPEESQPKEERQDFGNGNHNGNPIVKGKKVVGAGKKKKERKGAYSQKNDAKRHCKNEAAADETVMTRRRRKNGAASNPYAFYYYTGFGPSWRKRGEGGTGEEGQNGNLSGTTDNISSITGLDYTTSPSVNKFGIAINGDNGMDIVEEEYEDDDDGERSGTGGKKRMRKPVKARSLKSLM